MQWTLDKYNRLADTRNMPMMVERGPFEQLFLQFDYPLKMLFVYHNGSQLETFLLHPLVFPHDLVRKDQRILFCIKSQSEGTISMKFRVRFSTVDSVNNFCAAVGKFIGVKAFDEWNCRSSSPFSVDLNNSSIMSNNRSFADPDLSTSSISLLNSFSQSSKISSQDNPPFDFSQPLAGQRKLVDTCTQTDGDEENVAPNRSLASLLPPSLPSSSSSSVHLHVENLFSTEAVHAFGGVLRQLVNGGSGNGNVNGNRKVETRAQKKKKKANETMKPPKRPLNSYMLWNGVNVKRSSQEWRSLPAEEKEHWKLCAAVGRIRYKDQMEALQKTKEQ